MIDEEEMLALKDAPQLTVEEMGGYLLSNIKDVLNDNFLVLFDEPPETDQEKIARIKRLIYKYGF